jgi:hypothetical protein
VSAIAALKLEGSTSATMYPQLFQETLRSKFISHIRNRNFFSPVRNFKKKCCFAPQPTLPQLIAEVQTTKV